MKDVAVPLRGRPRSDKVRTAILQAAVDLSDSVGFESMTIEGVAAKARVGKQTIYRWWPNLALLLFEALSEVAAKKVASLDNPDSLKLSPGEFMKKSFVVARAYRNALAKMMALAQLDVRSYDQFINTFIRSRRDVAAGILFRECKGAGADPEFQAFVMDVFFGTLWYGILVRPETLSAKSIEKLVRLIQLNQ